MNDTQEVKPLSKASLTANLEHLLGELEHYKELVNILEQQCAAFYVKLKQLEKEKEQRK